MSKAFLSYVQSDKRIAARIANDLRARGINIWQSGISPGKNIGDEISSAVRSAKIFIVLVSDDSLKSNWFGVELSMAIAARERDKSRKIIPVILSRGVEDVPFLRSFQSIDLSTEAKYDEALKQLYEAAVSTRENTLRNQIVDATELREAIEIQRQSMEDLRRQTEIEAKAVRATQLNYVATSAFVASISGVLGVIFAAYPLLADRIPEKFPEWLGFLIIFLLGLVSGSMASKITRGIRSSRTKDNIGGHPNE